MGKSIRFSITTVFIIAVLLFSSCGMSVEKQAEMNKQTIDNISNSAIGDEVQFGSYNNHPIRWIIIEQDQDSVLLVSKSSIANMPYNEEGGSTQVDSPNYHANEWYMCSLREWLNEDFYEAAFDDTAKASIVTCNLYNSFKEEYIKSGGKNTEDKVFILSFAEAKKYLEPLSLVKDKKETYWLRNPSGTNGLYAKACDSWLSSTCYHQDDEDVYKELGVRPAIWLSNNGPASVDFHIGADKEDTNDYGSSSSKKGSSGKSSKTCPNCNGTGMTKTYATNDPWEEPTYIECPMCRGTGKVS